MARPESTKPRHPAAVNAAGSDRTVKVDVRVVTATNVDLKQAVAAKRFREDLHWRLAVVPLARQQLAESAFAGARS